MNLIFDNSYLGDVTNRITLSASHTLLDSIPITVQKLDSTTLQDVIVEILKGVFYLPSIGCHIGLIQNSSIDKDGNETITRAKYIIRPVIETIPLSKFSPTMMSQFELELIRKQFIFAHIMRYNITEDIIEIRRMNNVNIKPAGSVSANAIPVLKPVSATAIKPSGSVSAGTTIKKWFAPFSPKRAGIGFPTEQDIFARAVQEFLKPHRSPITLRYRMEKLLYVYIPEKKLEYDAFLNEVIKNITPAPVREIAKEPVKRSSAVGEEVAKPATKSLNGLQPSVTKSLNGIQPSATKSLNLLPLPTK